MKHSRSPIAIAVASLIAIGLVVGPALSASANLTNTGGTSAHGEVHTWSAPRTDTWPQNYDRIRLTYIEYSGMSLWVALRKSNGVTYARANSGGSWSTIINDATGGLVQPAGTFYLNTQVVGNCVGVGCVEISYNFDLQWNVSWGS